MDTPTYTATITIGGTSQTTEFTAFPSPREGKYLVTRQSGKLILTCNDANGDPYDLSSITPACAVIPWNSATSATSLGAGSISGVDNNIYTISWVRDTIPSSYSTYAQDRSGAIVLRVEFQESGTDDFFSCYTRFNVVDGDFAGDMQTLPLDLVSFTNYLDYSELTIDTGAITVTQEFQTVDTEGDASTDDLDTITPADAKQLLYLKLANASRIVTLKHGTGNLYLPDSADLAMKANQVYIFTYSDTLSGWNFATTVSDASSTTFTPAGNLASTNVQDALEELDNEKQPLDDGLTSIAGLTTTADRMIYTTASDTYAVATLTSAGRALIDDADATAQRSTLGLGSIATQASSNISVTGGSATGLTNLGTATYTELTIASGVATATQFNHTLDTEGDASTDDLDTLTVGTSNFILLKLANASRIVTLKDGTGNLDLGADIVMTFDTCYLLSYNGASWNIVGGTGNGSASASSESINQTTHGFSKYDAIYHNGTIYAKAIADDPATSSVIGIVSAVSDADNFTVTYSGLVEWNTPPTPDYTLGSNLFLSNVTAGLITNSTLTYSTGHVRQFVGTSLVGGLLVNISEGSEVTADTSIHTDVAGEINALTEKGSPASGDFVIIEDGADSYNKKKVDVSNFGGGGSTLPVVDTTGIAKGSVDATKIVRFEVDGLTTGTTRVITMPDNDVDLGDMESKANSALQNIVEDTTPQLGGTLDTNSKQVRWSKGADVASATALTLGTDGNSFDITGTTTITSINTLAIGTLAVLHFDGILTLTHHATDLILPTGANITTAVGDIAIMYEYATGDWRCVSYTRADGTALVGGSGGGNFPTSTDSSDKTSAYSVVSGDENTTIVAGSATSADFTITYDLSLWTTAGSLLTVANESAYIVRILVSNTGTMTIGGGIDAYVGPNETITMSADTATHVRIVARS